jgi:hypothetical protein
LIARRSSIADTLCRLVERELEVEHLAWIYLAVPDEIDQLGQEAAHGGRAAVQTPIERRPEDR